MKFNVEGSGDLPCFKESPSIYFMQTGLENQEIELPEIMNADKLASIQI